LPDSVDLRALNWTPPRPAAPSAPQLHPATATTWALITPGLIACLGGGLVLPYLLISAAAGPARLLYPLYCLGLAIFLIRSKRPLYPVFIMGVFAFTAYFRRIQEYHAGFSAFNPILLGPYFALFPTIPSLLRRILGEARGVTWPFTTMAACVVYGSYAGLLQMHFVAALFEPIRWLLPICFCTFIMERPAQLHAIKQPLYVALAALVVIETLYGIHQYLDPPIWDIIWMKNVDIGSFGLPQAYDIRVFSMMNSPLVVAVFTVQSMMLLAGEGLLGLCIGMIGLPLLAVTLVRESWIQFVVGMSVLFMYAPAKRKSTMLVGFIAFAVAISSLVSSHALPSFIQVQIDDRLNTFSDLNQDQSAGDRLDTYGSFYDRIVENPFGEGFGANASTATAQVQKNLPPLDSGILEAALTFGVAVGTAYFVALAGLFIAAYQAVRRTGKNTAALFAVLCAAFITLPIGGNQIGEDSILMWTAVGLIFATDQLQRDKAAGSWAIGNF
jgi:hypothetical protein